MAAKKNVVIVGCGFYGTFTARELASKLDLTRFRLILINPRSFYVDFTRLIRTLTTGEGKPEDKTFVPIMDDVLEGRVELKVASVVSFTETPDGGEVLLSTDEKVPYSVLVLAPGSLLEGILSLPESRDEIQEHLDAWRARISKARTIMLVGGGVVGVELAAEIKGVYPSKKVTLVHGPKQLLNDTYPSRYRDKLLSRLLQTGTDVVLGDYIDRPEPDDAGYLATRNGKRIKADLVIPTRGNRPNTSFISDSLGADALNSVGQVKVLPTFQLVGHPRIFAIGDVTDWKEEKQAAKLRAHVPIVSKNVLSILEDNEPSARYKGTFEGVMTTLGPGRGLVYIGILWGVILGDWFIRLVKP